MLKRTTLLMIGMVMLLSACRGEQDSSPVPGSAPPSATGNTPAEMTEPIDEPVAPLADVIEHDPNFMVGISYPPEINQYPPLVVAVREYTQAVRSELDEAIQALGGTTNKSPYELSLNFSLLQNTPQWVVIGGEGSLYAGKGNGGPLLVRFVWLPQAQKLLRAADLISSQAGWDAVSSYVSEQMYTAVSTRAEDESLTPEERNQLQRTANKAIAELTKPTAENFSQFEPRLDSAGKVVGLRFVFPPYLTSGPYSDGVQSVDVPVAVIRPHVAQEYQELLGN